MVDTVRRGLLLLVLGTAVGVIVGRAVAQDLSEATRPCKQADLVGAWEVIRLGTARTFHADRHDPAFFPHQQYVFYSNATMRHLASQTRITPADRRAMLATATGGTWAVDAGSHLLLLPDGQSRLEQSACLILVREVVDARRRVTGLPGDILLTHYDVMDKPVERRQLRRLTGLE